MADEPKNIGLGLGEQGWLRRQRAAEGRMVADKSKREEIMRVRKQHRERVEAEMAARKNGEEASPAEVEAEPFDYRNKDGFEMPTGEGSEDPVAEEEESGEEEPTEEESVEEEESGEEEEEPLKDVKDMSRQELNRELKERGQPVVGKPNLEKLRGTLTKVRAGESGD